MKDLVLPPHRRAHNHTQNGVRRFNVARARPDTLTPGEELRERRRREPRESRHALRHLHERYPIALRHVFAQMVPWVLCLGLLTTMIGLANLVDNQMFLRILPPFNAGGLLYILIAVMLTGAYLFYLILYRNTFGYWIEDLNFVIKKGIIFRTIGSYPLNRISDVYVGCSFPLALLGLYHLEVRTPSHDSEEFARIEGLSRKNALAIKSSLLGMLSSLEHWEKSAQRGEPLYQ